MTNTNTPDYPDPGSEGVPPEQETAIHEATSAEPVPAEPVPEAEPAPATQASAEPTPDDTEPTAATPAPSSDGADPKPVSPDLSPAACAAALAEHFPALFAATPPLPIKLRVHIDIQQRVPNVFTRRSLSMFLRRYTTSTAYLRSLASATHRFDLDGQPAGELLAEHHDAAKAEVERRREITRARRAAERKAAQPQRSGRRANPETKAVQAGDGTPPADATSASASTTTPAANPQAPTDKRPSDPQRTNKRRGDRNDRSDRNRPSKPKTQHANSPHAAGDQAHAQRRNHANPNPNPGRKPDGPLGRRPSDPAQRERETLLRSFQSSTLSKANFCALRGLTEAGLDEQLDLARKERSGR